jgi:hypothetical protein
VLSAAADFATLVAATRASTHSGLVGLAPATKKAPEREPFFTPRLVAASISLLAAVYLLQTTTPLRLDDDSVDYLNMASAITDRLPVPSLRLPDGYPFLVSALERAGLGSSFFFVLANCFFLAIGFYAFSKDRIYGTRTRAIAVVAGLLAVPIIRSAPVALPDAAFFGLSLLSLWCLAGADKSDGWHRAELLLAGSALTLASISVRYAGVALIPALLWVLARRHFGPDSRQPQPKILADAAVLVLFAGALAVLVLHSRVFSFYVGDAHSYYSNESLASRLINRLIVLTRSTGEIAINLPFSRFHSLANVFLAAGVLTIAAAAWLFRRPRHFTPQRVFLVSYLFLLVAWPNPAPRLWMPIIPIAVAEAHQAWSQKTDRPWMRFGVIAYAAWFCLTGVAALGYTTRVSLSGDRFTQVYGKAGGRADPRIKEGDPGWSHVQYYTETSARLLARYGDKRAIGH